MDSGETSLLAGAEIHGFQTAADLDVDKLMSDASTRWFRPNEVYAILSNYTRFKIQPQPLDTPPSGSVLLFDRKMLRNFRKDGHNWKKKKDGKTVQEAHEKLKIGNEERIHVYYARSEDDPNFYRRCYWLLDKNLERIVLVHYRQTLEEGCFQPLPPSIEHTEAQPLKDPNYHDSPSTPPNSASGYAQSETSVSAVVSEEINSDVGLQNHELSLHEINTLEWEDLVGSPTGNASSLYTDGDVVSYGQQIHNGLKHSLNNDSALLSDVGAVGVSFQHPSNDIPGNDLDGMCQTDGGYTQTANFQGSSVPFMDVISHTQAGGLKLNDEDDNGNTNDFTDNVLLSQFSLEKWNNNSLGLLDDLQLQTQSLNVDKRNALATVDNSSEGPFFSISDISPGWAYSTEETKVLLIGSFSELYKHPISSNLYCVIGEACVPVELFQPGVYRFVALPHPPGIVNLFLTVDGQTPVSQVLNFDYRCSPNAKSDDGIISLEDNSSKVKLKYYKLQKRLAYLLFKTTNNVANLSGKISPKTLKEVKKFVQLTSAFSEKNCSDMLKQCSTNEMSPISSGQDFLELVLRSKLQEWLLEKMMEGCRIPPRDSEGQGVIHLCVMLEYTWAVRLYFLSGLSLDFRDINGWTALHWAAYLGKEKMVATLLSAGANASLVADPTPEYPGGCTAADLAYTEGYHGLSGYLAEKGLSAHFEAMSLSGNVTVSRKPSFSNAEDAYSQNLSEQELCLKDSLAAYRNAADAADRIQAAIKARALKIQTKAVQLVKPEIEASQIVAALKIQHAFRNYNRRKLMKAAARIQSHFRTWKTRRNFLNMRRQAIRIQAVFRGHQIRRQYKKIVWSVGVLEKVILRWRLKRKGLRGIQVESTEAMSVDLATESTGEEEFYRISREQAEDRVKRSVVRVQSMFRSYRAQQEYRRMKLAYDQAKLEFNDELNEER